MGDLRGQLSCRDELRRWLDRSLDYARLSLGRGILTGLIRILFSRRYIIDVRTGSDRTVLSACSFTISNNMRYGVARIVDIRSGK